MRPVPIGLVLAVLAAGCTGPVSDSCDAPGAVGGPAPASSGTSAGFIQVEPVSDNARLEGQRILDLRDVRDPERCAHTTWLLAKAADGKFEETTTIHWATEFSKGLWGDWNAANGVDDGPWGPNAGEIVVRRGADAWSFVFVARA